MKNELPISTVILEVFGDDGLDLNKNDPDCLSDAPDPMGKFIESATLRKARTDVGLPAPTLAKSEWDEPLGRTSPTPSNKDFCKNSDKRFAKVSEKIRGIFGDGEEAEEVSELARRMRAEARAEVLATR
jgi:hypothetical protein